MYDVLGLVRYCVGHLLLLELLLLSLLLLQLLLLLLLLLLFRMIPRFLLHNVRRFLHSSRLLYIRLRNGDIFQNKHDIQQK